MPTALRRAVAALVDNALAHVEPGGTIIVQVAREGSAVVLRVRDDGAGFDPAVADELRQRFRRGGDDATATGLRVGLGLALVEEVVRSHGGRLELDGRPGGGATVSLVFESRQG